MELEAEQYKEFTEALISAFPTRQKLTQMLRFGSGKHLEAIASGGNLQDIVFELLQAAEAEGWLIELLEAARKANPNNAKLEAFYQKINGNTETKQNTNPSESAREGINQNIAGQGNIVAGSGNIIIHNYKDKDQD